MSDTTLKPAPLKQFRYPFKKTTAAEVVDPQAYYSALANAEDGFYPIGANGQWHGGIHFGSQTGAALAQGAGIRCIADGEVIAYRIDSAYPKVAYGTCGKATYSTGFALVRHRLQLPPAPKKIESAAAESADPSVQSARNPEEPSLLLYSLYMHLQHWKGYQDNAKKPRPRYWGDPVYLVDAAAADANRRINPHIPENGIGLNLRDADGEIIGFAPRGVTLMLGAQGKRKGYYAVTEVLSGGVVPDGIAGAYAYKAELTETTADPRTDEVVVLDSPIAVKAGDLMGHLGQYQRYADTNPLGSSCSDRPLVQLDVFTGDDVEDFIAKSRERAKLLDDNLKNLLLIEAGANLALPAAPDQQIRANEGIALEPESPKTGEWALVRKGALKVVAKTTLSGYNPITHSYGNGSVLARILDAQGQAIELDAYNALTDQTAYTQREVMVPTGEPVWVQRAMLDDRPLITGREMDAWTRFPLQITDTSGPAATFPRVAAIKTLDDTAIEADGTRWWQVNIGAGDGRGSVGWAREKDQPQVALCTPWDWPGFELVAAEHIPPATLYANHVAKQPQTPKDEQATLAAQGASAESSPLFTSLYNLIDLDGNQTLTATEIRNALKKPWLAQAMSRLIVRYDSEWAGSMDKWNAIDPLIPEPRKADWEQEKKRIESLFWWDELANNHGFPVSSNVHHFHPAGLLATFQETRRYLTYRIFHNGIIERLLPTENTGNTESTAHYIYIDSSGSEHDFGIFTGIKATRWIRKNVAGHENLYLVDTSQLGSNPARNFEFRFTGTKRRYLSQSALASLIGALMGIGYADIVSTGFSMPDGSPGISSSHINGENGDFRFLRTDRNGDAPTHLNTAAGVAALDEARQNKFNDMLHLFGWKKQLAWRYSKQGKEILLSRTIHYAGHYHHLHIGGYSPKIVKVER